MRDIRALYAFSFLKSLQFFGAVAVPFYAHRLGMGYAQMFTLEMIFSAAMMALEIPTGIVADRWGRKASLVLGSGFLAAGFLMFGIFRSFALLAVGELVCAAGMTLVSGADKALLYEVAKRDGAALPGGDAATVFSRYEAAGTAGLFVSFPLGSLFAGGGLVPYDAALGLVFVFTAAALALSGLAVLSVAETLSAESKSARKPFLRQGAEGFLRIFRTPQLRSFGLNYAVISALTFFMFWFYQSLLAREGFPVAWHGFVGAGFNLFATLLLRATPAVRGRLGTGRTLLLSSLIPGVLYCAAGLAPGLAVALIAIFGVTGLKLFRAPLLSALMNEWIDDGNRATVLSGISMLERVLIAALYPAVGALADLSLSATLVGLGCLTMICSLALRVGAGTEPAPAGPASDAATR
ncbi:MFS transporter [bacterium]|nr:MFS transporter [bacterium]